MNNLTEFFNTDPEVDANARPEIALDIRLAPWPFPDEVKAQYSIALYRRIFQLVRKSGLPVGDLSFTPPELAVALNAHHRATGQGGQVGWFNVTYKHPGREFGLNIKEDNIQLRLMRKPLTDAVECVKTFAAGITEALLEDDLEGPIQLKSRCSKVCFHFAHQLDVLRHKTANRDLCNYEIMQDAFSLTCRPDGKTDDFHPKQAIPSLGIKEFIRIDYQHHALMEFRGQKYDAFVGLEAPWNVTQKRLDVTAQLCMDESFGLRFPEALDWEIAFIDFYRNTVLQRFMANLFAYATTKGHE